MVKGVFRERWTFGDNDGYGFAHVADAVIRKDGLLKLHMFRQGEQPDRDLGHGMSNICRRENGMNSRETEGRAWIDPS
jgi:hypothetical protein